VYRVTIGIGIDPLIVYQYSKQPAICTFAVTTNCHQREERILINSHSGCISLSTFLFKRKKVKIDISEDHNTSSCIESDSSEF
jgi:hypothetical protein